MMTHLISIFQLTFLSALPALLRRSQAVAQVRFPLPLCSHQLRSAPHLSYPQLPTAPPLPFFAAFLPADRVASMLEALGPALDRVLDAAKLAPVAERVGPKVAEILSA